MSTASLKRFAMSGGVKRSLHWAGSILAIVGVVFVVLRIREFTAQTGFSAFGWREWLTVTSLAVLYGFASLMFAMAWWYVLRQFGATVSRRWAIRAYGLTQIAKYVPGNIFHLAGRQVIGVAAGVPAWPLAKSLGGEVGLISITGTLFGFLVLPLLGTTVSVTESVMIFTGALGVTALCLWRFVGPDSAKAFGWYAGLLTASGALFVAVFELVAHKSGNGVPHVFPLLGAYVLAWLAGLVTPGAPAGLGVRELALLTLLNGEMSESDMLFAVVLGRLVTVTGDVLYYVGALLLPKKQAKQKQGDTHCLRY